MNNGEENPVDGPDPMKVAERLAAAAERQLAAQERAEFEDSMHGATPAEVRRAQLRAMADWRAQQQQAEHQRQLSARELRRIRVAIADLVLLFAQLVASKAGKALVLLGLVLAAPAGSQDPLQLIEAAARGKFRAADAAPASWVLDLDAYARTRGVDVFRQGVGPLLR